MLKPEKRPLPIKIYNQLAVLIGADHELSFDKLIRKARKNTGHSNLGTDFNETPLKMLLDSINEEANLNPFGRLMISEKLSSQLENRLWAEHWFKRYPEILDQEVLPIIVITGLQRTGTTKMQRILSGLPGARALLSWEALYPAPIGSLNESSKRKRRTRRNEKAVKWISPAFHSIHPIHAEQPEEDVLLLDLNFMSTSSEAIMHVPSYAKWLDNQDHTEAYRYEKKLLKLLQWQRTGKFWVLKSPHHLQYLDVFMKVFPGSTIIWMHRPIEESVPSFLSMLFYSRNMFAGEVDKNAIKDQWLNKLSDMVREGLKFKQHFPEHILDIVFSDFMQSETDVLSWILKRIDLRSEMEEMINDVVQENKYVSNHRYQLSDWNLTEEELGLRFSEYTRELEILVTSFNINE
jgi:hypothetical protein